MMTDPTVKRGKHRAPSRWARHRPAHGDRQRGLISTLVPSWKFTDENRRPRSNGPGVHREVILIDDRSGPVWHTEEDSAEESAIHVIVTDIDLDTIIDLNALAEPDATDEAETVIVAAAVEPEAAAAPPPDTVVDRTEVLPLADTEETSSSLASLFGFGERQVSFMPDSSRDVEVTGDTAWDSLPTLADVAVDDDTLATTGGSIQRLWDATEDHSIVVTPIEAPVSDPQRRLLDSQRVRRSAVLALVAALMLVGWGVRQLSSQPERVAIAREAQYATAAHQISEAIGPVARSVVLLTLEDLTPSDFSQLTSDLDVLDGIARRAAGLAVEPLPRAQIVGSSLPFDELVLPQSLLQRGSMQALNIEQRIGDAVSYRLIFATAFDLPELPSEATLLDIGTIGADLSVAIAETEQVIAELPGDAFFASHRQQASDLLVSITDSQADYFDALRNGDTVAATAIRDAIVRSVTELRSSLSEPLAATEAWTQGQVTQLQEVLAELTTLVAEES